MNTKKFVLKNVTQGTQKNVTENQLLELDIDEMDLRRFLNERLFISSGD